jgi:hypothetical protein
MIKLILIGFFLFCLICLLCFLVYYQLDILLKKTSLDPMVQDVLVYLVTFSLAFVLAIFTAPFMGYGENPLEKFLK